MKGESSDALFDLALELSANLHLHPEILSKAERGYVLAGSPSENAEAAAAIGIALPSPTV